MEPPKQSFQDVFAQSQVPTEANGEPETGLGIDPIEDVNSTSQVFLLSFIYWIFLSVSPPTSDHGSEPASPRDQSPAINADSPSNDLDSEYEDRAGFNGFESSDEEDFWSYNNVPDVPLWQRGLTASDILAEEFELDALARGACFC